MECVICKCSCGHEFQDQTYGRGQRVHNPCRKGLGPVTGYRCTVCGRMIDTKTAGYVVETKAL